MLYIKIGTVWNVKLIYYTSNSMYVYIIYDQVYEIRSTKRQDNQQEQFKGHIK
jgi:hypothetical protein